MEKEVYGLDIDGEILYSTDIYVIVQEILAQSGCTYDLQKACKECKKIWGSGWEAHENACENGLVSKFLNEYPDFKHTLMQVGNCNSGRSYKTGKMINGMRVFKKYMTDEEFYRLPEYQ